MFVFTVSLLVNACGGSSSSDSKGDNGNNPQAQNRVNWSTVPAEFNPRIEDVEFSTTGFNKLNVDVFGFNDDVEVIYSNEISQGRGYLRLFKVWKEQANWGSLRPNPRGSILELRNFGTYQCSIQIRNGQITELNGGCYVRIQIYLPVGSEIEVYNVGQLITKRFIPVSTDEFLEQIDDASWAEDKFAVIESFLASYSSTSRSPSLTADQLGIVISEFSWTEEKLKALGRLHTFVSDRENLGRMIDAKFSYFDREKARGVVGL